MCDVLRQGSPQGVSSWLITAPRQLPEAVCGDQTERSIYLVSLALLLAAKKPQELVCVVLSEVAFSEGLCANQGLIIVIPLYDNEIQFSVFTHTQWQIHRVQSRFMFLDEPDQKKTV